MPSWFTEIRGRVPFKAAVLLGLLPVVLICAFWYFVTAGPVPERTISPTTLPSPGEVIDSIPDLFKRELWTNTLASFKRIGISFLVANAIVLPLGILMGAFGSIRATFGPLATAGGYVPLATLVPLTMSWFGIDELQRVMFLTLTFTVCILPGVVKAVDGVGDVYLRTAYTLGASRWQIVRRVLIPIAMPDIWHTMRVAFGVGWSYLVVAEVVVLQDGLGFLIQMSQRRGPREHMYLVIVVITIVAWLADVAWARVGERLFPYRKRAA